MDSDRGLLLNSIRDILYVVFRHKWKIVLFFILAVAVVTAVTFALPVVYRSDSLLLVRIGRENMPGDPSVRNTVVDVTRDRVNEVKSELAILSSDFLAEKVVNDIGEGWILDRTDLRMEPLPSVDPLKEPGPFKALIRSSVKSVKGLLQTLMLVDTLTPHEEAVKRFKKDLTVDVEKQTNILTVSYDCKNGALAKAILDNLVASYLERHVEVFATQAKPAFFEEQSNKLHAQLTQNEDAVEAFRKANNISLIQTQKETLLGQISALEAELSEELSSAEASRAQVASLQGQLKNRASMRELARTEGLINVTANNIKDRLLDLRMAEANLAARYPDTHRPLVELRGQIEKLEAELAAEPATRSESTTGLDQNTQGLESLMENEKSMLAARSARCDQLKQEISKHRESLAKVADCEMEWLRLNRDKELTENEYLQYRESWQKARISTAMDQDQVSNVSVVQPASMPLAPIKPKKLRNVGLGMLLGLFGGICLAFVMEYFDDSLNTTEAVRKRLGVPVLASVSDKELKACI